MTMRIAAISPVTCAWIRSAFSRAGGRRRTSKASAWAASGIASPNHTQTGQNSPPPVAPQTIATRTARRTVIATCSDRAIPLRL